MGTDGRREASHEIVPDQIVGHLRQLGQFMHAIPMIGDRFTGAELGTGGL
jgi:hypothetical protein